MKRLTLLLLIFVASLPEIKAQNGDYSFKETYSITSPARLSVSSFDGNIEVMNSNESEIQVFYIARKNGRILDMSREELEKEVILDVTSEKNSLKVSVKSKFENKTRSLFQSTDEVHVSFKVLVPKQTNCDLHSSDGYIRVAGLTSSQRLKTSDGNIEMINVNGDVTGHTSDGNIRLNEIVGSVEVGTSDGNIVIEKIKGNVISSTSDGNIELAEVIGDMNVKTSDGDIYFSNIAGSFKGTTSDGNVKGNFIKLNNELTVRTGDGNINIQIPDQLGLDLNIKGESLNVPLTNFSGKSDKKSIQGKSNGGGIAVNLSTSDGNITLDHM
jgi:hypothetical protein